MRASTLVQSAHGVVALLTISVVATVGGIVLGHVLPDAPTLIIASACLIAVTALLVQSPQLTLGLALIVRMLPDAIRLEPLYSIGSYGLVLLATVACAFDLLLKRRQLIWDEVFSLLCIYLIWMLITLTWAPDAAAGGRWIGTYGIGLALMVATTNQVRAAKDIDFFMRVLGITGWIYLLGGIYTFAFVDMPSGAKLKIIGTNVNQYAIFLVLMLPGVIWPVLRATGTARMLLMALSCFFVFSALVLVALTGSRGGALSLVLVLLSLGVSRPLRPWAMLGVSCLVAAMLAAPFLFDILLQRFTEDDPDGLGGRETLWHASLLLIGDHLLTGVGAGNGPAVLHDYIASLTSYYNGRNDLPGHNPILEVGSQSGVIGMILYVATIALAAVKFARDRLIIPDDDTALRAYRPLIGGCAIAYAVSWMKSGGMENDPSLFVLLSLLLIPTVLRKQASR